MGIVGGEARSSVCAFFMKLINVVISKEAVSLW